MTESIVLTNDVSVTLWWIVESLQIVRSFSYFLFQLVFQSLWFKSSDWIFKNNLRLTLSKVSRKCCSREWLSPITSLENSAADLIVCHFQVWLVLSLRGTWLFLVVFDAGKCLFRWVQYLTGWEWQFLYYRLSLRLTVLGVSASQCMRRVHAPLSASAGYILTRPPSHHFCFFLGSKGACPEVLGSFVSPPFSR